MLEPSLGGLVRHNGQGRSTVSRDRWIVAALVLLRGMLLAGSFTKGGGFCIFMVNGKFNIFMVRLVDSGYAATSPIILMCVHQFIAREILQIYSVYSYRVKETINNTKNNRIAV